MTYPKLSWIKMMIFYEFKILKNLIKENINWLMVINYVEMGSFLNSRSKAYQFIGYPKEQWVVTFIVRYIIRCLET